MARPFNDGPLTLTPALTYTKRKGVLNDVGDASGTVPGSTLTFPYIRPSPGAEPAATVVMLPVSVANIPGQPDPEKVFVISAATDMGATFTQDQLNKWTDLAIAIQKGYLTVTVAGTTPAVLA